MSQLSWTISSAQAFLSPLPDSVSGSRSRRTSRAHEVALLDFRASVQAPPYVIRRLRASLPEPAAWAAQPPVETARFVVEHGVPQTGWHRIERDGVTMFQTDRPWDVVPYLAWAINWEAVARLSRRYLLLHAGAVAWGGHAMLFPADSGSGKTTLVAGLLAAGFDYLSDDIVPMDPNSGRLLPFAKSLSLKPGGRRPLHRVYRTYGRRVPPVRGHPASGWALVPRAAWPTEPVIARYVVVPRYIRGEPTRLEPLGRGAAAERLFGQAFNVSEHGVAGVGRIVEMVRGAQCYSLTIGRLEEAVALLRALAVPPVG